MRRTASRLVLLMLVAVTIVGCWNTPSGDPAPVGSSPFSAVKWRGETPVVRIGDEWFILKSLDGYWVTDIIEFIIEQEGEFYQKRFSEDLVRMLADMGHPARVKVTVVLEKERTMMERTAAMTAENHRLTLEYNREITERGE